MGGGLYINGYYETPEIEIYNNLIYNNSAGSGGGIAFECVEAAVFNNTIINNLARQFCNSIYLFTDSEIVLFNNILWSDPVDGNSEVYYSSANFNRVLSKFNNIRDGRTDIETNLDMEPQFDGNSFQLSDRNACVGRGVDSVMMNNTWYFSPKHDYKFPSYDL